MEDLLEKIYHSVISNEKESVKLGKDYDRQMEEIFEPLKERFTEDEIDEIRECMYDVAYITEKGGFMLGVRFMAEFMFEIMER